MSIARLNRRLRAWETSAETTAETREPTESVHDRLVREHVEAMAAFGILRYDADADTARLHDDVTFALEPPAESTGRADDADRLTV